MVDLADIGFFRWFCRGHRAADLGIGGVGVYTVPFSSGLSSENV